METDKYPIISILVAARNEEASIAACLNALTQQDYPAEKFEILVGDDQSTDQTAAIVMQYEILHPEVHLFSIEGNRGHQKGKSNVLAHLAHQAKGEFLFITDADMTIAPSWLKSMLVYFTPDVGIITGVTIVKGKSLFAKLQNAEWLFYTAHGHSNSKKGKPVTAMGNNMAVRASAYWLTGGYEKISFSVTEDFELFREILKKGFKFQTAFEPTVLGYTNPIPSFGRLLQQRRRWFTGALQLPRPLVAGLIVLWAFLPILVIICCFGGWLIAAGLFFSKWIIDIAFLLKSYHDLKLKVDAGVWLYSPWSMCCNTLLLVLQLIPGPVEWKGRKYTWSYIAAEG